MSIKKNIKYYIKNLYGRAFFYVFRLFPVNKHKIFFSSFNGKCCDGNPKYIAEYLGLYRNDIKQVWGFKNCECFGLNEKVKTVKWGSISMIYEMATAGVWVDSHNLPSWVVKRKNQFFVQCWHGGLGMKRIVKDFIGKTKRYEKDVLHSVEMANVFISNSKHLTNIYRNSFLYDGIIKEIGFPKNDIFFTSLDEKNRIRKKVFDKINLSQKKKLVLYAPTFRENGRIDVYNLDFRLLKECLDVKFKDDFVIGFRLHPEIRHLSSIIKEKNKECIDLSFYDDMQELIIATDVFITDYSSGIFDFALLRRPGFLYAIDVNEYEKQHGLYYDLHTMPFPLAENNEQLYNNIINFDEEKYKNKLEQFFDDMGLKDNANSTKKVAKIIEDYIDNRKK